MTNALQQVEYNMTPDQLKERAKLLVDSGFLPKAVNTPEKAMTIMLTGRELGLGFMESLRSINVIDGKPSMSAQLMVALCQRTGELEDLIINEETKDQCTVTVKRKGKTPYSYTFSMADAKALGLADAVRVDERTQKTYTYTKDNWKKQPKVMLKWRAVAGALRVPFADAICGLYIEDEAEDIIQEKIVKEAEVVAATVEKLEEMPAATVGDVHSVAAEDELYLKLSSYIIQDTEHFKLYQDRTIGEIYQDKTPGGKPKGKNYLEKVAAGSSNPDDRANITKFIELVEKPVEA